MKTTPEHGWVRVDYSQSANGAIASGAVLSTGAGVYNLSEH